MSKPARPISWLGALGQAAEQQDIALPPFTGRAMGSALCHSPRGGRFISFRRPLMPAQEALQAGVEWSLWCDEQNQPRQVVVFREPLHPTTERIEFILAVLKGWLIDAWTSERAMALAAEQAKANAEEIKQ